MKLRATTTIVREYEVHPEGYGGATTAEECAAIDRDNYLDGEAVFFDLESEDATVSTVVEVVET